MRRAPQIRLHWEQRRQLFSLAESPSTPRRVALRARIALRAAEGAPNSLIAEELAITPATAALWRRRFLAHGVAGVARDAPRAGRPPSIPSEKVEAVIRSSRERRPGLAGLPSVRSVAEQLRMSRSTVQRIRAAQRTSDRSERRTRRPESGMGFLEMVTDLVGLYLYPPARAVAFSTDERLPVGRRKPEEIRSLRPPRRLSQGALFRAFLQRTEGETPRVLDVHLLVDSRLLPVPPEVENWLSRHPRFHLHFLPSDRVGSTLMDRLIDGFSRRKDRPGASASAHRLKYALREHLRRQGDVLAPFVWTAASGEIRGAYGRREIKL